MWHHLADILGAGQPGATALIVGEGRRRIRYGELEQQVSDFRAELSTAGLRAGDVLALQGGSTAEYVVALLAATGAGMVVAPMDPALPDQERRRRIDLVGARAVVADGAIGEVRDATGPAGLGDDDALVMLTSGTTGTPKMVPWTHRSLAASVAAIVDGDELTTADATVAVMPLFHGHGLVASLLATLTSGGTILLPGAGRFSAHTFADDMSAAQATWYTAVPTIHRIVLQRLSTGGAVLPELRFIRSCSAPLSPELAEHLETRFGTVVLAAYGMTETTHQASTVRPDDPPSVRLHTVGAPSGLTVRVADPDGHDCAAGESGEICFHGATVMRGYLGDRPADPFRDGWLRTGDLGSVDTDGNLTVSGRIKNLINRGGEKISPERVEQVLSTYPGVLHAAVVGVPDELYGEQVAAAIVTSGPVDVARLREFGAARLAPFEIPAHIVTLEQVPLTAKGDVDRTAVAAVVTAAV